MSGRLVYSCSVKRSAPARVHGYCAKQCASWPDRYVNVDRIVHSDAHYTVDSNEVKKNSKHLGLKSGRYWNSAYKIAVL